MAHPSWGSGWPNCQTGDVITVIIHEDTDNEIRIPVRKQIAPLLVGLIRDLEKAREEWFKKGWCWGGACRAISGTSSPSNHSWWLASDLDAPQNPYMSASAHDDPHPLRKRFDNGKLLRSTMPKNAGAIAAKWGFRWGGDYDSKPDPMHFEFVGSREDAARRVKALKVKERKRERRPKGRKRG
jgi:hypothetical protein